MNRGNKSESSARSQLESAFHNTVGNSSFYSFSIEDTSLDNKGIESSRPPISQPITQEEQSTNDIFEDVEQEENPSTDEEDNDSDDFTIVNESVINSEHFPKENDDDLNEQEDPEPEKLAANLSDIGKCTN